MSSIQWIDSPAAAAAGICVARVTGREVQASCHALYDHETQPMRRLQVAPPPLETFNEALILVEASDGRVSGALLGTATRLMHFQAFIRGPEPCVTLPVPDARRACAVPPAAQIGRDKQGHALLDAIVAEQLQRAL